jgi:hypothetical protein
MAQSDMSGEVRIYSSMYASRIFLCLPSGAKLTATVAADTNHVLEYCSSRRL